MTTIDHTSTLAELVNRRPELARELEVRGLDYCCGGARSLEEACVAHGLDPDAVASELQAAVPDDQHPDWPAFGPTELVDHLEQVHHAYLWEELPRLTALIDKIVGVHGERHPELTGIASCFAEIRADIEPHLVKEEQVLFPLIRRLEADDQFDDTPGQALRGPVSVMLREHDTVGELFARLRTLTADYRTPADGCASYQACFAGLAELEADTHLHIHKENNVLFPLVLRLESGAT
jgi:regulator of cell morphogenesis and NO signaling